jgi:hypothetical protein
VWSVVRLLRYSAIIQWPGLNLPDLPIAGMYSMVSALPPGRGETRPGGRAETYEETTRNGQVAHRQVTNSGENRPRERERHPTWMFLPTHLVTPAIGHAIPQAQADVIAIQ